MRHAPALAAALCSLLLLGCPDSTPTPPNGSSANGTPNANGGGGGGTQDGTVTDSPDGGAPNSTWQLIDDETDAALKWPLFTAVKTWPAPTALQELSDDERTEAVTSARILRELVELLVHPSLHPSDWDAALKRDAKGRLHLTIGRGRPQGSASTESHGEDFPPVLTVVLEKPGPQATNVAALREAVAQVVVPELAKELAQEDYTLKAPPSGVPGAANAMLDRSGFGAQFPYLYAYSSEGQLLLVFQEVPHGKAPR